MKNNPNNWFELLFEVKPWQDGMALSDRSLHEHEAQQVILARLYGAVRWGKDCFGLHPAGKLISTCQQVDDQTWEYQLTEAIAITITGQILVCGPCQQTLSLADRGLLVAVPIEQESLPAALWYRAEIKFYPEDEANALRQGVPIARWLGEEGLDENYLPPAMSLGAHPHLWQQATAIAECIERILEQVTVPNPWLLNVWVPSGDEERLMAMPPMEWLCLHLRSLRGLASQDKLRPLIKHLEHVQKKPLSLLNLTEGVKDIKTAWEIVEARLPEGITIKTDKGLFKSVKLPIERERCLDKSQCIVITIPPELNNTPLLLAVPTTLYKSEELNDPKKWAINLNKPSESGRGYHNNRRLNFFQKTAVNKEEAYWVCELPRPLTIVNHYGILTLLANVDDLNELVVCQESKRR
ncbi:MAG: hypothetical protein DRR08_03165 [Candidatus Parabeggiatoa sp. nov. 2]|nr:MAG: hypothetical protein B6247_19845 [Beggiatoa sp. 4572_84]RKZ63523.1 MAG: hypothetical protein DRR08_03165 [Gammaproteobacteria bacterium]